VATPPHPISAIHHHPKPTIHGWLSTEKGNQPGNLDQTGNQPKTIRSFLAISRAVMMLQLALSFSNKEN
jgi:hypothetical protein